MKTIGVEDARQNLGELAERARLAGEPTLITRYGRPAAVLVNHSWYERAETALAMSREGGT